MDDHLNFTQQYGPICREERQHVANLYAALTFGDNLQRFCRLADWAAPEGDSWEMAVEFSMLRDVWHRSSDNEAKRATIVELMGGDLDHVAAEDVESFNTHFSTRPSQTAIESPARWSLKTMNEHLTDRELFRRACKVKWGFRVKPDLVIRDGQRALCVEAKVASPESKYPSRGAERQIFKKRGLPLVSQTEVQRYVLEEVMGWDTSFVILSRHGKDASDHTPGLRWVDVRDALDLSGMPTFMTRWSELLLP